MASSDNLLHEMDENVTHLFLLLEPSLTPSRMPKPRVRKHYFQTKDFFVLENIIPNFGKIYWTTLRGELLGNSPKQLWVFPRDEPLDNSPRQFFRKSVTPPILVRPDWRIRTGFGVRNHILGLLINFFCFFFQS